MKADAVNIFIIDDDKILSTVVKGEIKRNFPEKDILFSTFETGELSRPHIGNKPDIAIIDYHMDSRIKKAMNGIDVIDLFRKESPDTNIILLTQDNNIGLAVEALTHGATDYVLKNDYMLRRLNVSLYQCFKFREMKQKQSANKHMVIAVIIVLTLTILLTLALHFFSDSLLFSPQKTN